MAKYFYSPTKQKVLLLLSAGVALGLTPSPAVQWRIIKSLPKAWKDINRTALRRIINEFKYDRLIDFRDEKDGAVTIMISEKGKKMALRFHPEQMTIKKPAIWDKKLRIVIFDIPEKKKAAREALRKKLRQLGFKEVQKSVWAYPYPCEDEIKFLAEFFEVSQHVRVLTVTDMSMDADIKIHFGLN